MPKPPLPRPYHTPAPLAPVAPLDQLRGSFAALHAAVREKIAGIVGVVVSDVVRRTVRGVLDRGTAPAAKPVSDPDDEWWDDDETGATDDEPDDRDETLTPPKPLSDKPSRLTAAVTLGVQAATWWSRRNGGRGSGTHVAAAGVVATAAGYLLGRLAVVAGAALSVLALADAAESATTFLS